LEDHEREGEAKSPAPHKKRPYKKRVGKACFRTVEELRKELKVGRTYIGEKNLSKLGMLF